MFFKKDELLKVASVLLIIIFMTLVNLRVSIRKSRDAQRKDDINSISNSLDEFFKIYGFFPNSSPDGRIIWCKADNYDEVLASMQKNEKFDMNVFIKGLRPCDWGKDGIFDIYDTQKSYLKTLPTDPKKAEGLTYFYISNTNRYQLYAYLEGADKEDGYRQSIINRKTECGNKICSFGKAYGETPLDKSIEEYENELLEKLKNVQKN